MKIKLFDIVILIIVAGATGFLTFFVYGAQYGEPYAHIKSQHEEYYYALTSPNLISVEGPLGRTVIEINEGAVSVRSSPCPEKTCVKSGKVSLPGEWIACLPNQVLITIEGRSEEDIDALSY
ncbi:MAG: NusG domain II-containing protein [Spirochaetales bacterium]|nr:NusG domain II-containing protein [Spirochaetales bacterium]